DARGVEQLRRVQGVAGDDDGAGGKGPGLVFAGAGQDYAGGAATFVIDSAAGGFRENAEALLRLLDQVTENNIGAVPARAVGAWRGGHGHGLDEAVGRTAGIELRAEAFAHGDGNGIGTTRVLVDTE